MTQTGQQLADTYLEMHHSHTPDLVDRYIATGYRNHNPFVADGREANRQLWTMFYAALPDLRVTQEDLIISGDRASAATPTEAPRPGSYWASPPVATPWR